MAYNANGVTYSEAVGFTLGQAPDAPSTAPESIASLTSSEMLAITVDTVSVDLLTTPELRSYSIDIDDGLGGTFTTIFGELTDSLATTANYFNVVQGRVYRVRYRVKNDIGWSGYSPVGYLRAADAPSVPPSPAFIDASVSHISL